MNEDLNGSWRIKLVFGLGIFAILFLCFRLFQKQILQSEEYRALARKQYTVEKEIPASRGQILVRDNLTSDKYYPIAINQDLYTLVAVPKNIKDKNKAANEIALILDLSEDEIFDKIDNDKAYVPPLAKKIDLDQAKQIEGKNIEGIMLLSEEWRLYPEENLASHVLGYVNAEGEGQYGVEAFYNEELKGKTKIAYEGRKNITKYLGQFLSSEEKINGSDVYLTIDRTIQYVAQEKLKLAVEKNKAQGGSIIVADPKTGEILAMASYPDFNPNQYNQVTDMGVFKNSAIAKIYEPGSVFKIFCMAGALDKGKVTPDTTGVFGASVKVGIETITNSIDKPYGKETMTQVLENSDNVGMVFVERELGHEDFYNYVKNFGFGDLTNIDLSTEVSNDLLPKSQWKDIDGATISFGQGIAVTPIQLIEGAGAIANGGNLIQARVVSKIVDSDENERELESKKIRQVISENTAKTLTNMMVSVVEKGYGRPAKVPGYKIAGKTGTAEIPNPNGRGYLKNENIGSFLGFAPADDPAFVMLVKLDSPEGAPWAESSVAPTFGEMAKWLLHYMQIPPQ